MRRSRLSRPAPWSLSQEGRAQFGGGGDLSFNDIFNAVWNALQEVVEPLLLQQIEILARAFTLAITLGTPGSIINLINRLLELLAGESSIMLPGTLAEPTIGEQYPVEAVLEPVV